MTAIQLATGLGGAIGSNYRRSRNQLYFVEFNGKVSRLDLVRPLAATVSQGTTVLKGTWIFDCETGALGGDLSGPGDIWWEQQTATERRMAPVAGAKIVNLGVVDFNAITYAELQNLNYGTTPIPGNADATNKLVTGDVFAVMTNAGNFAKVKVVNYGYNMTIQWVTYRLGSRYRVLGTGYNQPEDIVVRSDERYAYVTERAGNLLRVDLMNANRAAATVVSTGMTAPHQIALDEAHNQAYVVEFATPGRLLRIDLTSGAQTVLVNNLERAIGLLITQDLQFAYISEQTTGPDSGRVSRMNLITKNREVLIKGLTNPFFMTWTDAGESGILIAERDPANRASLIDLTQVPVGIRYVATGIPIRPSSIAVMTPNQILVCSDTEINQLDMTSAVYQPTGPMLLGIGHVPVSRISRTLPVSNPNIDGYADTSVDPTYFFQVKDAPFGGTLHVMFNHERAFSEGARFYKLLVDGVEILQSWSDYKWSTSANSFILQSITPSATGFYTVRQPNELWYNHWLGYMLGTSGLTNGLHTIAVKLFASQSAASEIGNVNTPGRTMVVQIDNRLPQATIDQILHDGGVVGTCAIVDSGSDAFTFRITAQDPEQHLLSWTLGAVWGDNRSGLVDSDSYSNHVASNKKWAGISGIVPVVRPSPWHATVAGDPTSRRCAHTFYLDVWDRVINGYGYIHYSRYTKSITIMLP